MNSQFAEDYARSMNQLGEATNVDMEWEISNLALFIEPMLMYPEQYILAMTVNRSLILYSHHKKQVLCPQMSSKADLWESLGSISPDADILTTYILELLVQSVIPPQRPMSLLFYNKLYTVEPQFIVGIEGSRNLILNLVPNSPYHDDLGAGMPSSSTQYHRDSAMKFNMTLNDYVENCRNDDIYYNRTATFQDPMPTDMTRRKSQVGDFIPTMQQPELVYYCNMVKDEYEMNPSRKLMESYYNDPIDPDTIPPSFAVKNTTNTGNAGQQISRSSMQGSSAVSGKRCYTCGTDKSPEWRRGPEGPKTLCNACGLRYAKQLRAGTA